MGSRKEAKTANRMADKRAQAGLAELTPESIQKLMNLFFSHYYSQLAPQMMGAQQGLAAGAARHGLSGSGLAQQLAAGIPGQFAMGAQRNAMGSALPTAYKRADIAANEPYTVGPSGESIFGSMLQKFTSMGGMSGVPSGGK